MHMHVIFADNSFDDPNVLAVADLHDQCSTPLLDLSIEYVIPILRHPHDVGGQAGDRMTMMSFRV